MNNLEQLVPPLELCKQIPEGAFADSALVWQCAMFLATMPPKYVWEVRPRNECFGHEVPPAPTLAEILEALPCDMLADFYLSPTDRGTYRIDMVMNDTASEIANGDTPATAALKLWMEVNK